MLSAAEAIRHIKKPEQVELPQPMGPPFKALGEPLQEYECAEEGCGKLTVSVDQLRMHCNDKHEIS